MQFGLSAKRIPWGAIAGIAAVALVCIWVAGSLGSGDPMGPDLPPAKEAAPPLAASPRQPNLDALRATGYGPWDPVEADHLPTEVQAGRGDPPAGESLPPPPRNRIWADDRHTILVVDGGGQLIRELQVPGRTQVEYARPLAGGRILALSVDEGLTLFESDGSVAWELDLKAHHEVTVVPREGDQPGARLFAVATHTERPYRGRRVRFDEVRFVEEATGLVADPGRWPTWDTFDHVELLDAAAGGHPHPLSTAPAPGASGAADTIYDYFHLNGAAFDGHGEMIVCLRNVSMIAGIDLATGSVTWSLGEDALDWPHAPSIVPSPDGSRRILAFDNGAHRGWSRIIEFKPGTGEITWAFSGTESRPLWSRVRGFVERLPSGNTLITESERGRAMEIRPDGQVIWEYQNPEVVVSPTGKSRRRIYRMSTIP